MHNEVVHAINLMRPYRLTHPMLVAAWTRVLLSLASKEEHDILRVCLDQLQKNLPTLNDIEDLTVMQMGLLLVINT